MTPAAGVERYNDHLNRKRSRRSPAVTSKSIAELRHEYALGALSESDVDPDPIKQFERWLREAMKAQLPEPNASTRTRMVPMLLLLVACPLLHFCAKCPI